jgi:hypothetical protein
MPAIRNGHRVSTGVPEETVPQKKAQIGGNHVIGLSSSATSRSFGSGPDIGAGFVGGVVARAMLKG